MVSLLRTLLAFVTGVIAAIMWLDRRPAPPRPPRAAPPPAAPTPAAEAPPVIAQVDEAEAPPDPQLAARIAELERELAQERALRVPEPGDAPPGASALRAARVRALELELQIASNGVHAAPRWFEVEPPALDVVIEAVADHMPLVALWVQPDPVDPGKLWRALGAMQEYAEASGGAWFEFDGDFPRWCRESGDPHALDPDQVGEDEERPEFLVELRINRSGRMAVPQYVEVGYLRLHYVDDAAGLTGRMHVVGLG